MTNTMGMGFSTIPMEKFFNKVYGMMASSFKRKILPL